MLFYDKEITLIKSLLEYINSSIVFYTLKRKSRTPDRLVEYGKDEFLLTFLEDECVQIFVQLMLPIDVIERLGVR